MEQKDLNKLQQLKNKLNNEKTQNEVKHIDGKVENRENKIYGSNGSNNKSYGGQQMEIKRGDNLLIQLEERGVGSEQSGTRYGICIQNDVANKYSPTIIVAFVTSRLSKAKLPVHIEINGGSFGFPKDSVVLVEQIRTIDKKRIIKKVGKLDELTMERIDNAIDISVKTLKPKSYLEKLPQEMRQFIISTLKQIKKYEITTETMKNEGMSDSEVQFMVNKKLSVLNKFIGYCKEHQIDYTAFYKLNEGVVNKEIVL